MEKIESLKTELQKLEESEKKLMEDIRTSEQSVQERERAFGMSNTLTKSISEIEIRIAKLKSYKEKLSTSLQEITEQTSKYSVEELNKTLEGLNEQENKLKVEIDNAVRQIEENKTASRQIEAMQHRINEKKSNINKLEEKLSTLSKRVSLYGD
jgi:chromosome segregation ATPase